MYHKWNTPFVSQGKARNASRWDTPVSLKWDTLVYPKWDTPVSLKFYPYGDPDDNLTNKRIDNHMQNYSKTFNGHPNRFMTPTMLSKMWLQNMYANLPMNQPIQQVSRL